MKISVQITRQENANYFNKNINDIIQVEFEEYVAAVVASEIGNASLEACKA
jgi:peptidoglycan hydrolase-like amidase